MGMFGPTFGQSAEQIQAMGLSSDPYQAQKQVATGNYKPNATAPISNKATVGTSGMAGGMRMTDEEAAKIFADMKSGAMDAKTGALKLSQGQVNLYDMARISGQSAKDILQAAANNGIHIEDSLGQNGVIQQGGLLSGMSMADAAKSQGGAWVDRNAGTGQKPAWEYQGPQGGSFGMDLSRMTMGGKQTQTTINNWAQTAQKNMDANIAANGASAADRYDAPLAPGLGADSGSGATGSTTNGTGTISSSSSSGSSVQAPTDVSVNYDTSTVEGRIKKLLDENNPVIQQAGNRAMQQFASRGLLNSSMAIQAANEAMVAKAIEIAGPDAATYFKQSNINQDATNQFLAAGNKQVYDLETQQRDADIRGGLLTQEYGLKDTQAETTNAANSSKIYADGITQINHDYTNAVNTIQQANMDEAQKTAAIEIQTKMRDQNIALWNRTAQSLPGWQEAWAAIPVTTTYTAATPAVSEPVPLVPASASAA